MIYQKLSDLINFLEGKKTYIAGALGLISVLLYIFGYIDEKGLEALLAFFGFSGLMALRDGISKLKKK